MPDGSPSFLNHASNLQASQIVAKTGEGVLQLIREITQRHASGTYFFRSDTGTGKTTGMVAALKHFPCMRIAIAVPTTQDAQMLYERTTEQLGSDCVGVWTRDHEDGVYGNPVSREIATRKQVFIGTHMFLLGETDPRRHVGERDLLIVDEIPQTMQIQALTPQDFTKARERAYAVGLSCAGSFARAAEWATLRQMNAERVQQADFRTLALPNRDLVQAAIAEVDKLPVQDRDILKPVLDLFEALDAGRGFERVQRTGKGHRLHFVYFGEPNVWFPKRLILSATPHLDGFQHSPSANNMNEEAGSFVRYDRLHIHEVPWPDLPKAAHDIVQDCEAKRLAVDHMRELISRTKSDQVLLVVPKALRDEIKKNLEGEPIQQKQVHVTNWGRDVGSNEYRDCGDVILWSNFHKPKHTTVAEWFVYSEQKVNKFLLKEHAGGGKLKPETIGELQQGQLYAQIKQMGCRGRARYVDDDGVCQPMHLWICWDDLDPPQLHRVFPRAEFTQETNFEPRFIKRPTGTVKRAILALGQQQNDVVFLEELTFMMEVKLKTLQNRTSDFLEANETLGFYGWRFVAGQKGRHGQRARFERLK
ncbi:hypothetical protein HKCCSP123_03145 [Rhodobacterales bacterium HKCCSP123]|nr:hypothetical protein [Rhodobacterales bacterium HKCCSP123]